VCKLVGLFSHVSLGILFSLDSRCCCRDRVFYGYFCILIFFLFVLVDDGDANGVRCLACRKMTVGLVLFTRESEMMP
jgi:hypothetical protein